MNLNRLYIVSAGLICMAACLFMPSGTSASPADSIGIENVNGKKVILHRIEPKETYFSLGRRYHISTRDIMELNKQQPLKVGGTIRIPTGLPYASTVHPSAPSSVVIEQQNTATSSFIEYKVGRGETLYTIAKRFETTVEEIRKENNLSSNNLREGQLLNIPQGRKALPPPPPPTPPVTAQQVVDTSASQETDTSPVPTDRYGLRQINEQGVGVWIDDLNLPDGTMLALHKTAPVGTVIKITNPMTDRTTFAKVVGKYTETQETKDAIIVISKAAASLIGVIDRRFRVTISYGVPHE